MAARSESFIIGSFPSLMIYTNNIQSSSINFSLDFNITSNDSIKINQFLIIPDVYPSYVEPNNWSATIGYYSSSWNLDVYSEGGFSDPADPFIIQIPIDDMFNLNHKQYSLSLTANQRPSQNIGISSSFLLYMDMDISVNTKPTVTSGKLITPFEIAVLAAYNNAEWQNSIPIPKIDKIRVSEGNRVRPNTLSAGTPITAAWYNS